MKEYRYEFIDGHFTKWASLERIIEDAKRGGKELETREVTELYSVKYFDINTGHCKRGIQVEAESIKEANAKAMEILAQRGHTEVFLTRTKFVKKVYNYL